MLREVIKLENVSWKLSSFIYPWWRIRIYMRNIGVI